MWQRRLVVDGGGWWCALGGEKALEEWEYLAAPDNADARDVGGKPLRLCIPPQIVSHSTSPIVPACPKP
jgi:hypothetical protein